MDLISSECNEDFIQTCLDFIVLCTISLSKFLNGIIGCHLTQLLKTILTYMLILIYNIILDISAEDTG